MSLLLSHVPFPVRLSKSTMLPNHTYYSFPVLSLPASSSPTPYTLTLSSIPSHGAKPRYTTVTHDIPPLVASTAMTPFSNTQQRSHIMKFFAVILAVLQLKFGSTLPPNTLIPGPYNEAYSYATPILLHYCSCSH